MALPWAPRADGGIGFRLFGFPVRIEWSFWLIVLFLAAAVDLEWAVVWMIVLLPSVLVHELGHAFAARRLGAEPSLTVYAFGGLTSYTPPRPVSRAEAIGVSLAGPLAGFALGAVAVGVAVLTDAGLSTDDLSAGGGATRVVALAVWINLAWGALNLLPVLPLDGGHVMQELLPGNPADRRVRAAGVSVAVAVVAALGFWRIGYGFAAFLMGVFAAQGIAVLTASRRHRHHRDAAEAADEALRRLQDGDSSALADLERIGVHTDDPVLGEQLTSLVVEIHASTGRPTEARRVLAQARHRVHPAWYGLVAQAEGDPTGNQQVIDAYANHPTPAGARALVLSCGRAGRDDEVVSILASRPLTSAHVTAAATAARSQRREDLARHIETALVAADG